MKPITVMKYSKYLVERNPSTIETLTSIDFNCHVKRRKKNSYPNFYLSFLRVFLIAWTKLVTI